jgi:hypothetical protein
MHDAPVKDSFSRAYAAGMVLTRNPERSPATAQFAGLSASTKCLHLERFSIAEIDARQ